MKQWHPIFAELLQSSVQAYYEVRTAVPVGDLPRQADFVLLRRTHQGTPPFQGLWRHLTQWNILEFKGPTVSPRRHDLELLVELGLGIHRRLHDQPGQPRPSRLESSEVSFWYVANRLGRKSLAAADRKLRGLTALSEGLWRCEALGHLVFLVSGVDLPVEEDSLPLHVLGIEPAPVERAVAAFVADHPGLQEIYGGWVASLHSAAWKEMEAMGKVKGKTLKIDLLPAIEYLGLGTVIEQVGTERVIEQVGVEKMIEKVGLDKVIQQVGLDKVIEHVGEKKVIQTIGMERWLANLSLAERRELKRRLE